MTSRITSDEVNASNAYRYSDNFQIVKESTGECIGCEHNQTEADAIARYLTNYHGQNHCVIRNGVDLVRKAKEIRKGDVYRTKHREMILSDMGVGK